MKLKLNRDDRSSPNSLIATLAIAVFVFAVFSGQSLWVPASRIENLHLRAIALSMTDAAAAFASETGLDSYVPALRLLFLERSGLASHAEWDSRYFNRRKDAAQDDATARISKATTAQAAQGSAFAAIMPRESAFTGLAGASDTPGVSGTQRAPGPMDDSPSATVAPRNAFPSVSPIHSRDNPLRIFFFGDSQVFSLGSGLSRLAGKDSAFKIELLAVHSSGFIRSDYYDWPSKLSDTFAQGPYEAAVMMLGMNDHQSFRDETGAVLRKGTPEWEASYKDKCRAMIDLVLASVPRLYWVGMPAVKNGTYDASLAYIDSVQRSLAEEYSPEVLAHISIRDAIPGEGKAYADSVNYGNGKTLRVMSSDGSHFTVEGGQLAMKPLFETLCRDYLFSEVPVANLPE